MKNGTSAKQLAANRRNAKKSTGPRTVQGRAVSKMNALKHGILSKEVLVGGENGCESAREFTALHRRFVEDLQPDGPIEEMLVDQIVTAHWRLRRALRAEAGETALSVDRGHWKRTEGKHPAHQWMEWRILGDPVPRMEKSSTGCGVLEDWLSEVRAAVEREGELSEPIVQGLVAQFGGTPNHLTTKLDELRQRLVSNPDGLDSADLRSRSLAEALACLDRELQELRILKTMHFRQEDMEEDARMAAAALPSADVLEKIQRYETKLNRQIFRALAQLERLQRQRRGEVLPAPLTVELSERE